MTEPIKGPARFRPYEKGLMADVLIFDEQFAYATVAQAKKQVEIINKALSPLLSRAAMATELAKQLMVMVATHGEKCSDLERGYGLCDAAVEAKRVLQEFHSLTGKKEGG